jgi:hypothetical protein
MRFASFVAHFESTALRGSGATRLLHHAWTSDPETGGQRAGTGGEVEGEGQRQAQAGGEEEEGLVSLLSSCACVAGVLLYGHLSLSKGRHGVFLHRRRGRRGAAVREEGGEEEEREGEEEGREGVGGGGGLVVGEGAGGHDAAWEGRESEGGGAALAVVESGVGAGAGGAGGAGAEVGEGQWMEESLMELKLLVQRLEERREWLAAVRAQGSGREGQLQDKWLDPWTGMQGAYYSWRWVAMQSIRLLGLDDLGDDGWGALVAVLAVLLCMPVAIVCTASDLPMYDRSGWLHVARVKVPLGVYFLVVFSLSLRACLHLKAQRDRSMLRPKKSEAARVRDTSSNRLSVLAVVIEAWQLSALSFAEGLPYDTAGALSPPHP